MKKKSRKELKIRKEGFKDNLVDFCTMEKDQEIFTRTILNTITYMFSTVISNTI